MVSVYCIFVTDVLQFKGGICMIRNIAIIMGGIYKNVNRMLLEGILEQSNAAGLRSYVFTLNDV